MKLHKKIVYYKKPRIGREPCKYVAVQPKGKGTDVYATIKLDPILRKKKLKAIKNGMLKHEEVEIKRWAKGDRYSHRDANNSEPQITKRLGGVQGFWAEAKRKKLI